MRTSILAVVLFACSSKGPPETRGVDVTTIKADAVNALVPEPLRAKLVFAPAGIDETAMGKTRTFTMASPRGWYPKANIAWLDSPPVTDGPDAAGPPSSVSMIVRQIENENWAGAAELREFLPLQGNAKIVKDDITPNRRTRIVDEGRLIEILTVWTEPGAVDYAICDVTLFGDYRTAAAAFEKACEAVNVSGLR